MARALAGACARASPKPVTFFARKGADCLGKFAGDAERTLRLLFEEVGACSIPSQLDPPEGVQEPSMADETILLVSDVLIEGPLEGHSL